MKILGRPRQWKNEFTVTYNYEDVKELVLSDFLEKNKLPSKEDARKGEFLISLLTDFVEENGYLHVKEPNQPQKKILNNAIINRNNIYKSQHDIVEDIMNKMRIEKIYRGKLHSIIKSGYKDELERDRLYEIIRMNYSLMN